MGRKSERVAKANGSPKQMGHQSKRVAKVNGLPKITGRQREWVAKANGSPSKLIAKQHLKIGKVHRNN
jgi:hypothetical protein